MQVKPAPSDPSRKGCVSAPATSLECVNPQCGQEAEGSSSRRTAELLFVVIFSLAITSLVSHVLLKSLGIRSGGVGYKILGSNGQPPSALAEGSSLMVDGISWQEVSDVIGATIENWFAAGSSPSEWEVLQRRSKHIGATFIGVSPYDLNEESLCDSRAEIVPLPQTVSDLRRTHADWQFTKRLLTQYPINLIRRLFPTIGRSDGVMVGIKEKLTELTARGGKVQAETGPVVAPDSEVGTLSRATEKLTDWPTARVLRRVTLMRSAIRGVHRFDGPKKLALMRMLERARTQGKVVVIVLPVSGVYAREFLSPETTAQFEAALNDACALVPEAYWFRLDREPDLRSDSYFYDLVHLNAAGQQIATAAFVKELRGRWSENSAK